MTHTKRWVKPASTILIHRDLDSSCNSIQSRKRPNAAYAASTNNQMALTSDPKNIIERTVAHPAR
jgi:hypothetical protein